MGLAFLLVILIYVALLIAATVAGYRFAKARGWSRRKSWLGAATGFLLVFLPMFWDWLPTVWLHSYYCERYAGLTVHQTPNQWKDANPDIAKTLVRQQRPLRVGSKDKYYFQLNQRFRWEIESMQLPLWLRRDDQRVVDGATGQVLSHYIDFSTGQSGTIDSFRDYKFWMNRNSCERETQQSRRKEFNLLTVAFENLGGKE
ncbi:MAG: hypothetical protein WBL29_16460 [Burkholderiales bacterium]